MGGPAARSPCLAVLLILGLVVVAVVLTKFASGAAGAGARESLLGAALAGVLLVVLLSFEAAG